MTPVSLPPAQVVAAAAPAAALTGAAATAAGTAGWQSYTVRAGDTLWELAGRLRVSVGALVERNGLASAGAVLHVGDRLLVPGPAGPPGPAGSPSAAPSTGAASSGTYVVRAGDSLWSIATAAGIDVPTLSAANGLSSTSVLLPGRRLTMPGAGGRGGAPTGSAVPAPVATAPTARTGSTYGTYVVRPGDTAWEIARRLRVDVQALLSVNGLRSDASLMPGKRLTLPGGATAARAAVKASRTRAADTGVTWVTARAGDSLWAIAQRYGVSVTTLAKVNGRSIEAHLHPGERLRVAGSVASSAAAPSRTTPLSQSAAANLAHLNSVAQPSRTQVRSMIVSTARAHGVDPRLALAIAWQESRWSQRAVSEVNAIGVMQCLPSTGEWVSSLVGRPLDLLDAQDNVTCGVALLRSLARSASSEAEAVGAYYQGLASVRQRGLFEDTKDYVAAVLAYKSRM